jgi:hypothetical protein
MPFLTYSDSTSTVLGANDLKFAASFSAQSGTVSRLTFYLSKYAINGTWLGFSKLANDLEVTIILY